METQKTQQLTDDIQNQSTESLNNSEIIDSQTLQQSTNDIQNESSEDLNNSEVDGAIENENQSENNSTTLQPHMQLKTVTCGYNERGIYICKSS